MIHIYVQPPSYFQQQAVDPAERPITSIIYDYVGAVGVAYVDSVINKYITVSKLTPLCTTARLANVLAHEIAHARLSSITYNSIIKKEIDAWYKAFETLVEPDYMLAAMCIKTYYETYKEDRSDVDNFMKDMWRRICGN